MTSLALTDLHDDILISTLSWIDPLDILSVRKTCKRLYNLTHTRIVWTNACIRYILAHGFPFRNVAPDSLSIGDLERSTLSAYHLGQRWRSKCLRPRSILFDDGISSASITDVQFLPGHGDKWLLTISKCVWSVLTLWDVSSPGGATRRRQMHKWSPKGGVFKSFCVNSDPTNMATLAIALLYQGKEMLYILSIDTEGEAATFNILTSFPTNFTPVTLVGDIVGLSDGQSQISIWNWRANQHATLSCPGEDSDPVQKHNVCSQIIFSRSTNSVLVVRDDSISLFPFPELKASDESPMTYTPIAWHHFGFIDGITATLDQPTFNGAIYTDQPPQSISLLLRRKSFDPWHSSTHSVEHHVLLSNPTYDPETPFRPSTPSPVHDSVTERKPSCNLPYLFPPVLRSQIPKLRGSLGRLLHKSNIILGRNGTAVWINPQDHTVGGLYFSNDDSPLQIVPYIERSNQRLMAAVFHGPLSRDGIGNAVPDDDNNIKISTICVNDHNNNWTALDYDEVTGRIAIGSASGDLLVFAL